MKPCPRGRKASDGNRTETVVILDALDVWLGGECVVLDDALGCEFVAWDVVLGYEFDEWDVVQEPRHSTYLDNSGGPESRYPRECQGTRAPNKTFHWW